MAGTVAYDTNHFLLTWGGYACGGHETWQCSLRYAPTIPSDLAVPPLFQEALTHISMSDIYNAAKLWMAHASANARYDQNTSLEYVKLAAIGKDGHYLFDPT